MRICLTDRSVPAYDDHVTTDDSARAPQSSIQLLSSAVRPYASRLPQAIVYISRATKRSNEHGHMIKTNTTNTKADWCRETGWHSILTFHIYTVKLFNAAIYFY